jgi:hypothetical protein
MGGSMAFVNDVHCDPNDGHAKRVASREQPYGESTFFIAQARFFGSLCMVVARACA